MYNSGQTGIDDVRIETGNLLPADYPDAQITKKLNSAFSTVQMAAGRTLTDTFDSSDVEAEYARELELKIAARDALKSYISDEQIRAKVEDLTTEINEAITFLKENLQEAGGAEEGDILFAVTPYLSYTALIDENPDNTDAAPYRSGITDNV